MNHGQMVAKHELVIGDWFLVRRGSRRSVYKLVEWKTPSVACMVGTRGGHIETPVCRINAGYCITQKKEIELDMVDFPYGETPIFPAMTSEMETA